LPCLLAFILCVRLYFYISSMIRWFRRQTLHQKKQSRRTAQQYTFHFSHFCEKARRALDLCHEDYVEICLGPVVHVAVTLSLNEQKTISVPILVTSQGEVFADSVELEKYFTKELGPAVRLVTYYHALKDNTPLLPLFLQEVDSVWQRLLSTWFHPSILLMMKKLMSITPHSCEKAKQKVKEVMSKVERLLEDGRRYLCNTEHITAANITFAACLIPLIRPPVLKDLLNVDVPLSAEADVREFLRSPAAKFALRLYEVSSQVVSV
jgi:glutathione S-transferase